MSRTIKYRVWDNENKSYDDPYSSAYYAMTQDGGLDFYCHGDHMDEANPDVYFIEQYTGLTDKNGKEIYDGDILGGIFEGCYIGWCDTTKSFELFNCYEHYCMACDGDILWCELSDSDIDLEVIGNIHENPELLGGEE